MKDNLRGLLLARDELSAWFGSFDKYSKGKGNDVSQWLSMFNASPVSIDRKTGEPRTIYIPAASVSITGGIQPGILRRSLTGEHLESGLASRFLYAFPPRKTRKWTYETVPSDLKKEYEEVVLSLMQLQPTTNEDGEQIPETIKLSSEANLAYVDFYNRHGEELSDLSDELAAAWSKLEETPLRIALVIHLVKLVVGDLAYDGSNDYSVSENTIKQAITITEWFKHEAKRIYCLLKESDSEKEKRKLVDWIRGKGGSVTPRMVQQGCSWLKKTGQAEEALNELFQEGYGKWVVSNSTLKGGRPSRTFVLNDSSTSTQP